MTGYIVIGVIIGVMLLLFPLTRWFLKEVWTDVLKPILLVFLPSIIHWIFEAHLIILKNLLPRSVVVKTLNAKYQSKDRK